MLKKDGVAMLESHDIVVTAYGDSPHIDACIQSLQEQTVAPQSIVITTSTPSIFLHQVAARHRLDLRINHGPAHIGGNWNFAFGSSDAGLLTLGHQDDLYLPDYCAQMMSLMTRHPDALIGFSDSVEHTDNGARDMSLNLRIKRYLTQRAFRGKEMISARAAKRRLLAWGNPVCCPSVVFRRTRLAGFKFDESMRSNLDWDAWTNLADAPGEFVYASHPLVSKRVHVGSETSALLSDSTRLREDEYMFRRHWPSLIASLIAMGYRASYRANRS